MENSTEINYQRIAKVISYIHENFKSQPDLDELAAVVHLSPFHFQRLFSEWAGTTPKKFLQYLSIEYAKSLLKEKQLSLFDTANETGLSGTGRLHDLFISIEGMTPGEYKDGGKNLSINYSFAESPFGHILIASTPKGICHLSFYEDQESALQYLFAAFPKATFINFIDRLQQNALMIFNKNEQSLTNIKLHLRGTEFQLKVWQALLRIPSGQLSTYGKLATEIHNDKASRAVGTAIGSNPVAYLIPCHRVIQSGGSIGGYMWGSTRKAAIIAWEACGY